MQQPFRWPFDLRLVITVSNSGQASAFAATRETRKGLEILEYRARIGLSANSSTRRTSRALFVTSVNPMRRAWTVIQKPLCPIIMPRAAPSALSETLAPGTTFTFGAMTAGHLLLTYPRVSR